MELNREQIIKALECCKTPKLTKCEGCPRDEEDALCMYRLSADALSLIKELTQANEQLSESYDHLEKTKDELLAERSRLTEENERISQSLANSKSILANSRADTVRKMQERLTTFFANDDNLKYNEVDAEYINEMIDQIAKEMEGV